MKKTLSLLLALVLLAMPCTALAAAGYSDVPADSWAVSDVQAAKTYGLMEGTAPGVFGYGHTISRAQFVTVLCRMLGWNTSTGSDPGFTDTKGHWAAAYLAAAAENGAIDQGGAFRPDAPITREDMAVMLVRALGYQDIAQKSAGYDLPFTDVTTNRGYIVVAYDIGMTKGVSGTRFAPASSATREQAAAMLVRMYEKYTAKTNWLHGFYAISSYSQISLTRDMDAVSLGWSRMTYTSSTGPALNTTSSGGNVYAIPAGYEDAVNQLRANGCQLNLSVFMDNTGGGLGPATGPTSSSSSPFCPSG